MGQEKWRHDIKPNDNQQNVNGMILSIVTFKRMPGSRMTLSRIFIMMLSRNTFSKSSLFRTALNRITLILMTLYIQKKNASITALIIMTIVRRTELQHSAE